tara:strand:- start:101 stop:433 length:333 start_codon:yes stop_codon:yes gene_type:complete
MSEVLLKYRQARFELDKIKNKVTKNFIEATDNLINENKLESQLEKLTYLSLNRENKSLTAVITEYRMDFVISNKDNKEWLRKAIFLVTDGYEFNGFSFTKGDVMKIKNSI